LLNITSDSKGNVNISLCIPITSGIKIDSSPTVIGKAMVLTSIGNKNNIIAQCVIGQTINAISDDNFSICGSTFVPVMTTYLNNNQTNITMGTGDNFIKSALGPDPTMITGIILIGILFVGFLIGVIVVFLKRRRDSRMGLDYSLMDMD